MSIYINKDTKVITQGITGKTGQFHTEKCIEYANGKNCFVAGVNPKKAGESIFGVPIFSSVKDAAQQTGATVSVIYVPPAGAAAAIWEAVEADLDLAICITEGIPVRDMLEVRNKMKAKEAAGGKKTLLLGPNCPGLITPDEIKIGEAIRGLPPTPTNHPILCRSTTASAPPGPPGPNVMSSSASSASPFSRAAPSGKKAIA